MKAIYKEKISEFVDIHLKTIVEIIKSHIKDITDFIKKIEMIDNLPKEAILVTMDVKSLFTQIPHSEGINAVAKAMEKLKEIRDIVQFLLLNMHLSG